MLTPSALSSSFITSLHRVMSPSFINSLHNAVSRSFHHFQPDRPRRFNIEGNEDPRTSNDRFSESSEDSDARLDLTTRSNLQALRPMLGRAVLGQRRSCGKRVLLILVIGFMFVVTVAIIWTSLTAVLIRRLSPPPTLNGLHEIVNHWRAEDPDCEIPAARYEHFSRDIEPVPCHSHNDYLRRVPLYQALEAGCISVEADIWLQDDERLARDLYVGHSIEALDPSATLQKLYINPLVGILEHQNTPFGTNFSINSQHPDGVFDSSPETSLVLLLDFKNDALKTWTIVQEQLEPLRKRGMLTSWNGTTKEITQRPITVVGTGNAPFEMIIANSTYRDIFFDAPLDQLNSTYSPENSYYASVSFQEGIGKFLFQPSWSQTRRVKSQIAAASRYGLKARYWDTPSWPIARRNRIWNLLVENRVGVLNVDDVASAGRWNWNWCVVAGLVLCG